MADSIKLLPLLQAVNNIAQIAAVSKTYNLDFIVFTPGKAITRLGDCLLNFKVMIALISNLGRINIGAGTVGTPSECNGTACAS